MKLYHTSEAPIYWVDGGLNFKRKYPPDFLGLHAWHELRIAKERISYSCNDFLYEFEYPIECIEELRSVEYNELQSNAKKISETAVKLKEDSGAGKNQYHAVIIDYSHITGWRELYANKDSNYLTGNFNSESQEYEPNTKIQSNELEGNSKIKDYAKYLILVIAFMFAWVFDGYIQ